jgi:hypothetical protein
VWSAQKCTFTKYDSAKIKRGFDLICDGLPFGRLWYLEVSEAIGYAQICSQPHDAVIRVYDATGNVIGTHEHKGRIAPESFLIAG